MPLYGTTPRSIPHSKSHARDKPRDIPVHWGTEYAREYLPRFSWPVFRFLFHFFCIIAFNRFSLESKWEASTREDGFEQEKERVIQTLTKTITLAGLLLASVSALITTPPPAEEIINYTHRGPYICLWVSFALLLGGIAIGVLDLFGIYTCTEEWMNKVVMGTRLRVWFTLIVLAYPNISIVVGVFTGVFGLLSAAWMSHDRLVRIGCIFLFLFPFFMVVLVCVLIYDNRVSPKSEDRGHLRDGDVPLRRFSQDPNPDIEQNRGQKRS